MRQAEAEKAKTFRIKRVNCDIFYFATDVRKTRQCHVFIATVNKFGHGQQGKNIKKCSNPWIVPRIP